MNFLSKIILPNSLISIGNRAFIGCNNLNTITLPKSIKTFGKECFESNISTEGIKLPAHAIRKETESFKEINRYANDKEGS